MFPFVETVGCHILPLAPRLPSGPLIFVAATAPVSEPIVQESIPVALTEGLYVKPLFPGIPGRPLNCSKSKTVSATGAVDHFKCLSGVMTG